MKKIFLALILILVPYNILASTGENLANITLVSTKEELTAALTKGGNIKLISSIDIGLFTGNGFVVPNDVSVILDLNGFTLSGQNADENIATNLIYNQGVFVIVDNSSSLQGKISLSDTNVQLNTYSKAMLTICNTGTLILKSGTVENLGNTDIPYAIDNNSTSSSVSLAIEGGSVISNKLAIRAFANSTAKNNKIMISGGKVIGQTSGIWLQQTNKNANIATLNISGGLVQGKKYNGIYASVNNSSNSSPVIIEINGGTVINNSLNFATINFEPLSGYTLDDAILNLTITSGTIYNENASGPVIMDTYYPNFNYDNMIISGGTFSSDPASKVPNSNGYTIDHTYPALKVESSFNEGKKTVWPYYLTGIILILTSLLLFILKKRTKCTKK